MSRVRFLAVLAAALLVAASTLSTWALLARHTIVIGGGGNSRYYSVVRLDRWTGRTWRLDNSGLRWNPIAEPAPAAPAAP